MNPSFVVPAEHFYALAAHLPPQVTADTRFRMACLQEERQTRDLLRSAAEHGTISAAPTPELVAGPGVTPEQAARRLRSLGRTKGSPECQVVAASDLEALIGAWLDFNNAAPDDDPELDIAPFWTGATGVPAHGQGHLRLVLCAVTETANVEALVTALNAVVPVASVAQLVGVTAAQWNQVLQADPTLLPDYTKPGSLQERIDAFIRHLEQFFDINVVANAFTPEGPEDVPTFGATTNDPLTLFLVRYQVHAGAAFVFGTPPVANHVHAAAADVFPEDERARRWLEETIATLNDLFLLTDIGVTPELRIALMEALYARGFTRIAQVAALALQDFADALTGTVAFDHAAAILAEAGGGGAGGAGPGPVQPVNPDDTLVNCVPPRHLSPLGPVAYLQEMLRVSNEASCEQPAPPSQATLANALQSRRGPLANLHVTRSNLDVPLPVMDLVNECLEAVATHAPAATGGVVYDTASASLNAHALLPSAGGHDATTLFAMLPEHSSPAVPVKQAGGYDKLREAFSACVLPYSQPLDVNRSYLRAVRTSRYAVMRRFRKAITEFVLDPTNEPAGFRSHQWRYPVRFPIAREYLGINPEEDKIFVDDIADALLAELYGLSAADPQWVTKAASLPHFLEYTCLEYCELFELWLTRFVPFHLRHVEPSSTGTTTTPARGRDGRRGVPAPGSRRARDTRRGRDTPPPRDEHGDERFPHCPPCCLGEYVIEFDPPLTTKEGLKRLAVFIRLWRKLQDVPGAKYTFMQLRDICEVLQLFDAAGVTNPDFVRQLAAFQMLRDHLALELVDRYDAAAGTGADRTHLLALWVGPTAKKWGWAVDHLLDQIRHYAKSRHHCRDRSPEFIKLLAENLDPLSLLAGFAPADVDETWHAHPTHTLRFAEILAKIYASRFAIGEILFLFTAADRLGGDDPFPLQPANEAGDDPLQLPDDVSRDGLWELRRTLLGIGVSDEEAAAWTWDRTVASLHEEFGLPAGLAADPLQSIGEHFFPSILEAAGHTVSAQQRRYKATLNTTSALMWNTPADGPFRYDQAADELYTQIAITDEAVVAKVSRVKPLATDEQNAVRDVYWQPRVDLARLALLFPNFQEADEHLIQEPDEQKRWAYFQRAFATFYARCTAIAAHLATHVAAEAGPANEQAVRLAWRLLRHLLADENRAQSTWEADSGHPPSVTWDPLPSGGAFAALLGLMGGGIVGELRVNGSDDAVWREIRGPLDAFGAVQNEWNTPAIPLIPSMSLTLTDEQLRFVGTRNGFALTNVDGSPLSGGQGFRATWRGVLLVEASGVHTFYAGSPTPDGEEPSLDCAEHQQWRVTLTRGQRVYVLLSHRWPQEVAPPQRSEPVPLRRGAYDLTIEFIECAPEFDDPEDITRQKTGFQLKYSGAETADRIIAIPSDRLFLKKKDEPLALHLSADTAGQALDLLQNRFVATLRDVRRTYQRAYKALLFAYRFGLSAEPVADDLQSEIGYMLAHAEDFSGLSFFAQGPGFAPHRAWLDFNFLPVGDNYVPPTAVVDQRIAPSIKRQRAMFDWWERAFDYIELRTRANTGPERPAWLLFHEAAENHPDDPAHALRHIGVDLSHADLVRKYYKQFLVTSNLLEDERWPTRLWRADEWIERLRANFMCLDVRAARPDLWASDDPGAVEPPDTRSGNDLLTKFVEDGFFENEDPRRYEEVKRVNDALRERARDALLAYLAQMNRVPLPWGGFAHSPKDLSELLLLDVEAGICQRASRIEEAITAVQSFVQRARLGLEPSWVPGPELPLLWDRKFATYYVWHNCKLREVYSENWIEWEELAKARMSEAFHFLEDRLRSATLTAPAPAGLVIWNGKRPPPHPGLQWLQVREPSWLTPIQPPRENFSLLGTEERQARPSWLSSPSLGQEQQPPTTPPPSSVPVPPRGNFPPAAGASGKLPWWIEAAIRLGVRFVRVAAAGRPMGSAMFQDGTFEPGCVTCCTECGVPHPPVVDEYYFWLLDSRYFESVVQDANVTVAGSTDEGPWHDETALPKLLHCKSDPMVHLFWTRVHNGELKQTRRSSEGVRVTAGAAVDLGFVGRFADSLCFEVIGGVAPPGFEATPNPGFRYDLLTDAAHVLPPVVADLPVPGPFLTAFSAYPFFAYFEPGAPLVPLTFFSQAIAVAGWLRAHCRHESALKWYEAAFDPMRDDAAWCRHHDGSSVPVPSTEPVGVVVLAQPSGNTAVNDGRRAARTPTPATVPPTRVEVCCKGGKVTCEVARDRAITLLYLETLLEWGDAIMRRHSPEAFHQARLIYDTAASIAGETPESIHDIDELDPPPTVANFVPLSAPLNQRLLNIYERLDDRLALIHACLNSKRLRNGVPNLDMPYFGNSSLRDGWQIASNVCADDYDWCLLPCPYRFTYLVQKAGELAGEVRAFGSALLGAYEKGDAEFLASLRAAHERQLLTLALSIRQNQWRDADWQVQALRKTKEIAQTRRAYYQLLIDNGLNGGEIDYRDLTNASTGVRAAGNVSEAIAQLMHLIPDVYVGTVNFVQLPVGSKLASVFSAVARVANTVADIMQTTGSVRLNEGGWDRREDEWRHQVEVLDIEIEQVERQILGGERRRDIALRELNNHQRQIEQSIEVQNFLRDKFTSHELYLFLQRETAALHFQMYELAHHAARQTQRAFNYERGHTSRNFLPCEIWDDLHEGLLAGERLALSLRQMEKTYLDENTREYELHKSISLRQLFPLQFLQLKITGKCEFELPEWLFDLDYPGQYMRRVKSVALTIPAVVGPYSGVHCRLTLLSSATRVDPRLRDALTPCCEPPLETPPLKTCGCDDEEVPAKAVEPDPVDGYLASPDDPRVVRMYAAREAIATSSGQTDSGMFELNFRDERYLPFEFAGAVSRWRIELPAENNYFDMTTLSDVVMQLNYTAREGGDVLRKAARDAARRRLPDAGRRVLDVQNEFPDAWHRFRQTPMKGRDTSDLELCLESRLFAFLPGQPDLRVTKIDLLIEKDQPCADLLVPAHHTVWFLVRPPHGCKYENEYPCVIRTFECVSNAVWPGLYHGTIDVDIGPLRAKDAEQVTFRFPAAMGRVKRLFVACEYEAESPAACDVPPIGEWIGATHAGRHHGEKGMSPGVGSVHKVPNAMKMS